MIVITAKTKSDLKKYWTGWNWSFDARESKTYTSKGRAAAALNRLLKSDRWDESQLCDFKVETISITVGQRLGVM